MPYVGTVSPSPSETPPDVRAAGTRLITRYEPRTMLSETARRRIALRRLMTLALACCGSKVEGRRLKVREPSTSGGHPVRACDLQPSTFDLRPADRATVASGCAA